MITIGTSHGITAIYGAVIASGVFMIVMAPVIEKLVRFFPPLVTGNHHRDHRCVTDAGGSQLGSAAEPPGARTSAGDRVRSARGHHPAIERFCA